MSKRGPCTPEGVAAVTRNLPAPQESGPRTELGKRRSSLNALKHGLTVGGFLPCKKAECHFKDVCGLRNTDEGRRILELTMYGDPCPEEVIYYYEIRYGLANDGVSDDYWAHTWAMNEVRMARRRKLSAVDIDLIRQVPCGCTGCVRPDFALAFRYQDRLHRERDMLLCMRPNANLSGVSART